MTRNQSILWWSGLIVLSVIVWSVLRLIGVESPWSYFVVSFVAGIPWGLYGVKLLIKGGVK